MKGMGDKYCVYVDDFYKPYYLDTNLMHVDTFELPKKVESSSWAIWAILFHSCQNSENLLVRFTSTAEKENTELFFLMYPQ